jgi:uncharacterized SAM-binding protein YcdF (DUF218 family)
METSQSVGDRAGAPVPGPIYEVGREQARKRPGRVDRIVTGAVVGAALWIILVLLGVPNIFGIGGVGLLPVPMAIGGLLGLAGLDRVLVRFTAGTMLFALLIAFTPLMRGPTDRIIRRDPVPASADAIVVLSAGVSLDGMVRQQGMDRLLKGIELARAGTAPRLVLTRERKKVAGKWVTSEADQNRLSALAETQVVTTGYSASTREEALRVRAIAAREGWKRIVLVTSPFHSRRACATFEKVGLTVSCVPADSRDVAVGNLAGPDDRLRAFAMWTYELAGTVRYWAADWI